MRAVSGLLAMMGVWLGVAGAVADDDALAKQKKSLRANMKAAEIPETSLVESPHLLVCGTLPADKLRSLSAKLERQIEIATKALRFDKGETAWPGKLAVYVFEDRAQFRSFVRQVEKRSPDEAEQGSQSLRGDVPHVAVGPGKDKSGNPVETQGGLEVAAAILAGRAKAVPLPEWVVVGFGRATAAHAAGQSAGLRKKAAKDLIRARLRPRDAWNEEVPREQRMTLAQCVMDFLAYGGGAAKPIEFLGGFRGDDEKPNKTGDDALAAANMTVEQFEAAFLRWLVSSR